jgi:uncharacterized small protein (DUF1192 family)
MAPQDERGTKVQYGGPLHIPSAAELRDASRNKIAALEAEVDRLRAELAAAGKIIDDRGDDRRAGR